LGYGYGNPTGESGGSYQAIHNRITGSIFSGRATPVVAEGVSAYLYAPHGGRFKCAIYRHSDSSFLGGTEEVIVPASEFVWKTARFPEPKPILEADVEYVLVAWGYTDVYGDIALCYQAGETNQGHYQALAYNSWPDPASFSHEDRLYSIYCQVKEMTMPSIGASGSRRVATPGGVRVSLRCEGGLYNLRRTRILRHYVSPPVVIVKA